MKQLLLKLFIPIVLGCNQPNILYIMLDDLGYEDLGFQGSDILTPNIDRLASEGEEFTLVLPRTRMHI